jgi:hypothetical protein
MKIILLAGITLFSTAIQAQDFNAVVYSAEGSDYYQISGALPQSAVAFYSESGGGKLLYQQAVNESGILKYSTGKKISPAFILNTANASTGKKGSNMVFHFTGQKEFTIENIKAKQQEDNAVILWDAAVTDVNAYEFIMMKSTDGVNFNNVATIEPHSTSITSYQYIDKNAEAGAYYQVQVHGKKKNLDYYSRKALLNNDNAIRVYPTAFTDIITVELNNMEQPQPYLIENMQGQTVQKGVLKDISNKIEVKDVASGVYFIKVASGAMQTTKKIIKR